MSVEVYKERKALVLSWDKGDYEGPVTIRTESAEDTSATNVDTNAGHAAVSFPMEHTGSFTATVLDADGNELDSGEIEVT